MIPMWFKVISWVSSAGSFMGEDLVEPTLVIVLWLNKGPTKTQIQIICDDSDMGPQNQLSKEEK